jgi:hypothetical protein
MALEHVPRCQHVKVNGVQCGSPALRRRANCYFHTRVEYERELAVEKSPGKRSFGFPLLEDANSVQVALMKVIQMLGSGALDHRTAALMLYGLQTASTNLRHIKFEHEKPTEVVIDEDTVDLTRIKGPQWSAHDFAEEAAADQAKPITVSASDAGQSNHPPAVSMESDLAAEPDPMPKRKEPMKIVDEKALDYVKRREQKRNLPGTLEDNKHEPSSLAKILLERMGIPIEDDEEEGGERNEKTGREAR